MTSQTEPKANYERRNFSLTNDFVTDMSTFVENLKNDVKAAREDKKMLPVSNSMLVRHGLAQLNKLDIKERRKLIQRATENRDSSGFKRTNICLTTTQDDLVSDLATTSNVARVSRSDVVKAATAFVVGQYSRNSTKVVKTFLEISRAEYQTKHSA